MRINNNSPTLIIFRGPPASGKTFAAKQYVLDNPEDCVRVSRDDIRQMFGKYWVPSREDLVSDIETNSIRVALINGYDVIIDATNLNPKTMDKWHKLASDLNVCIQEREFLISYEEAVRRDKGRELEVGEKVILDFFRKYYPNMLKTEL